MGSACVSQEIIRKERLREMQEQRMAEEQAAARHLKENSKPHFGRVINGPASSLDLVLASANNNNNKRAEPEAVREAEMEAAALSQDQEQVGEQVAEEVDRYSSQFVM